MGKRRNALRRGKAFEEWVADKFREVYPTVQRRKKDATLGYAVQASDLEDHDTPYIVECKKRAEFPAMLEKWLAQAQGYDSLKIPVVVIGDTKPGGVQDARVYLPFLDWLELQKENDGRPKET